MNQTLTFLGGAGGTVTGSKHLLENGASRVLLDCGLFQGLKVPRQRNWAAPPLDPRTLGAVILSHAHIDHSGYLPPLPRRLHRAGLLHAGHVRSPAGDAAGRGSPAGRRSGVRQPPSHQQGEIKMLGAMVPVNATVMVSDAYSAHADRDEILRWLGGFKRPPGMTEPRRARRRRCGTRSRAVSAGTRPSPRTASA